MSKILLVEDDDYFRSVLKMILEKEGFSVAEAPDGAAAQHILGISPDIDLVLSDIRMPNMDGMALLKWVKETKKTPVILMTGFSEILAIKDGDALGADGFLPKPFEPEDILGAIHRCLGAPKEAKTAQDLVNVDDMYCPVAVEDFVMGSQIPYAIYIRFSETKYVKVANQGEDMTPERVNSYKEKGLSHLYLTKDDFRKYVGLVMTLAQAVKSSKSIAPAKKKAFLAQTGTIISEKLYVHDLDQETFAQAKSYLEMATSVLTDNGDALNLLMMLNEHADFLYAHSLGVSMYSTLIARQMRWTLPQNLFKVSMGGLLHDIGKKELDRELITKARKDLTPAEISLLETHPTRGMEILLQLGDVPSDVVQIAAQHHEQASGYGFPLGLKKNKIHPCARVIAVADAFCNAALENPKSKGMSGADAIRHMATFHKDALDPMHFAALIRLYKLDPAEFGVKEADDL